MRQSGSRRDPRTGAATHGPFPTARTPEAAPEEREPQCLAPRRSGSPSARRPGGVRLRLGGWGPRSASVPLRVGGTPARTPQSAPGEPPAGSRAHLVRGPTARPGVPASPGPAPTAAAAAHFRFLSPEPPAGTARGSPPGPAPPRSAPPRPGCAHARARRPTRAPAGPRRSGPASARGEGNRRLLAVSARARVPTLARGGDGRPLADDAGPGPLRRVRLLRTCSGDAACIPASLGALVPSRCLSSTSLAGAAAEPSAIPPCRLLFLLGTCFSSPTTGLVCCPLI